MDLITIPWINVSDNAGQITRISPIQIADHRWVNICEPRPDFKGAVYQFLIGLLQTCFQPDEDDWEEYWHSPPTPEVLSKAFAKYQYAFTLKNDLGPAFMQDLKLNSGENLSIANLLIESPGENTIQHNKDLFIKRGKFNDLCFNCAAKALFTLQLNAPSGGQGHRVGLRGGGPLTTLVMPCNPKANLWQRLWLNVLNQDKLGENTLIADSDIFPWLAPTRTSEKTNSIITPAMTNVLQMYWAMPRRIRLNFTETKSGFCDLCGQLNEELISSYLTKNYGIDYKGPWVHPLTPYRKIKENEPPLSIKGQKGGLGYRHWLGLILGDEERGESPAFVVKHAQYKRMEAEAWCFGYDMDNMKARCWYEHTVPVFHVSAMQQPLLSQVVRQLLAINREALKQLKIHVKKAWFHDTTSKDGSSLDAIEHEFWQNSERQFYADLTLVLSQLKDDSTSDDFMDIYDKALKRIVSLVKLLFDRWTIAGSVEDLNMERIFTARKKLAHWLKYAKLFKSLGIKIKFFKEIAV